MRRCRFAGLRHVYHHLSMSNAVFHRDPQILGGAPVFVGTRVPVQTLMDCLEQGDSLGDFLADFPSVTREQAVAALELAKQMLIRDASAA